GGAAKIDDVVLERVPADEQPVAARLLDRALQLRAAAAPGALEQRRGPCGAALELRFGARVGGELREFQEPGDFLTVLMSPKAARSGQFRLAVSLHIIPPTRA